MTTLCVISARAGGRGLPGGNPRPMLGKPLIVSSTDQALACTDLLIEVRRRRKLGLAV